MKTLKRLWKWVKSLFKKEDEKLKPNGNGDRGQAFNENIKKEEINY